MAQLMRVYFVDNWHNKIIRFKSNCPWIGYSSSPPQNSIGRNLGLWRPGAFPGRPGEGRFWSFPKTILRITDATAYSVINLHKPSGIINNNQGELDAYRMA